jgi:dUTP pyrophosphatase
MHIRIVNKSGNPLPSYSTEHAAGMDLRADIQQEIILEPLQRKLIPTGIYLELPVGYEAQIRPRSGMALKHGISVLNTPGTIDADYRGEVGVIVVNLSSEAYAISPGERICQMVISKHETAEWIEVEEFQDSGRCAGGFGHTGKK